MDEMPGVSVKRSGITGRISADFRAEFYNLTNTPLLGSPNTTLSSASFGSITSAGDPRVMQFAIKLSF